MVLDGTFVLELFHGPLDGEKGFVDDLGYSRHDPIFAMRGAMHVVRNDMILLENQISRWTSWWGCSSATRSRAAPSPASPCGSSTRWSPPSPPSISAPRTHPLLVLALPLAVLLLFLLLGDGGGGGDHHLALARDE
ncbi:hypothetical protein ACP70R_004406 [Stipagrostis hirtigluma subsp. patula]